MKQALLAVIKEIGINKYIAAKAMYLRQSEGLFTIYDRAKLGKASNCTAEQIAYDLNWQLSNYKDFAQYQ